MKKIILVVLILSITLSSCSIQKEENKPLTIGEIDRFFTENFDDFQKIVQLYYQKVYVHKKSEETQSSLAFQPFRLSAG